jgi:hypothetical protein
MLTTVVLIFFSFFTCCQWRYPALRVAYIEEKEVIVSNRTHKVYSSVLIKGENNLDQVMFIEYGLKSF